MLSATRPRTADAPSRAGSHETQDVCVRVRVGALERRLDHRIEDEDGSEIGSVLEQPRPGLVGRRQQPPAHRQGSPGNVRRERRDGLSRSCVRSGRPCGRFSVTDGVRRPSRNHQA